MKLIYRFFILVLSFPSYAVNVGDITSIINSDETSLAKEIKNSTNSARFVSVSVSKISSPLADGVESHLDNQGELIMTPASLVLPGNATEMFRFFYKGPNDDKERYYRLKWVDEPIVESGESSSHKTAVATTSAEIGTILVVAPRNEHFDFKREGALIKNTGNVSFRVISYGECLDKKNDKGKGCRERYYVLPGTTMKLKKTDINANNSRIGIWHGKRFINVK